MVKLYEHSALEVWCAEYINKRERRNEEDKDAVIVQIEGGIDGDYIVEVLRGKNYDLMGKRRKKK